MLDEQELQEMSSRILGNCFRITLINSHDDLLDYIIINGNEFTLNEKRLPLLRTLERDLQNLDNLIDERENTIIDISNYFHRRDQIEEIQEKMIYSFLKKYDDALEKRLNFYYRVLCG